MESLDFYIHEKDKETLHILIKIFDLFRKQSKYWFLTERVAGSSVEKLYICSTFYSKDRESKTSSHLRSEVTRGTTFDVLIEDSISIFDEKGDSFLVSIVSISEVSGPFQFYFIYTVYQDSSGEILMNNK